MNEDFGRQEYLVTGTLTRTFEMWVSARSPEEAHAHALEENHITETEGPVLSRTITKVVKRGGAVTS